MIFEGLLIYSVIASEALENSPVDCFRAKLRSSA
jgi:hypothetical protein